MSQTSTTSTVPSELTENQDQYFIDELNAVDSLYFSDRNTVSDFESVDLNDEDNFDINYDSDVDDDQSECVPFDLTEADHKEYFSQAQFKNNTCGCREFYGKPCSDVIDFDGLVEFRENCKELSREELDVAIKAELLCHRHSGKFTDGKHHAKKERERPFQEFYLNGKRVCRTTFCFAHCIDKKKLQALGRSLDETGLKPRVHGKKGLQPPNSLTWLERENIKTFICRYGKDNGLPLPGRLPNHRESRVIVLPSDNTVSDIHQKYQTLAHDLKYRTVSLRTFMRTWHDLCPYISVSKPSTDICQSCQKFVYDISNSGHFSEDEKFEILRQYQAHLDSAKQQREYYRQQCQESKLNYSILSPVYKTEDNVPCSTDADFHYSWDYAQQVHFPHYSQEVGPVYFKTPRKCNIFGMCSEGSGKQVFYLIDESEGVGKGADSVVSMVHHYFNWYGHGEENGKVHFDNCAGQNKNNVVLWYGLWRLLSGLHKTIEFSTMVPGHTKFEPDWHFGIWKNRWRKVNAETIYDVAKTVDDSSRNGHNISQLVNDPNKPVTFYQWRNFLSVHFKPLKNLTKYRHFFMSADEPGTVHVRTVSDSVPVTFNLLKSLPAAGHMPEPTECHGLTPARQWYLFEQIRQHCLSDNAKNLVCPKPVVPKVEMNLDNDCDENWKVSGGCKRKKLLLN